MLVDYSRKLVLIICLQAASLLFADQPVELKAYVDKAVALTSDTITLNLDVITTQEFKTIPVPEIGDKIEGLRVIDFGTHPEKVDPAGRITRGRFVRLKGDISGSYVLPSFHLEYQNASGEKVKLASAEIFIELNAEAPKKEDEAKDIRPLKGLNPTGGEYDLLIAIVGALLSAVLLGLLGYLLYKRLTRKKPKVRRDPYEVALEELAALKASEDAESRREFYFYLSQILRNYFEVVYSFRATDRTLEEMRIELPRIAEIDPQIRQEFLNILEESDLVKFADLYRSESHQLEALERVRHFLTTTRAPVEDRVV